MISRIEVLNYRCLRYVSADLAAFQVLVGPNGSGKTTLLDVLLFLRDLITAGLDAALEERSRDPLDLVWARRPGIIEIAIEAKIPEVLRGKLSRREFGRIRYEVRVSIQKEATQIGEEKALLMEAETIPVTPQLTFPEVRVPPPTLLSKRAGASRRTIFTKREGGNDYYYSEVHPTSGKGWIPGIRLGPKRSTFGNLLEDETRFPVSTWLKEILKQGVQRLVLNSAAMRQSSPPGQGRTFRPDGSNLPWVVAELGRRAPEHFRQWVEHVRTAIPEIASIRVQEREDDRHAYLIAQFADGMQVPSWGLSDGTLRLLALTLPAYLPATSGIYLVEEPENGVHPRALEAIFQSLSSVYAGQVLVATHSPLFVAMAEPEHLLCFARTPEGSTDVVRGDRHPVLRDWRREVNLADLFASGVLG